MDHQTLRITMYQVSYVRITMYQVSYVGVLRLVRSVENGFLSLLFLYLAECIEYVYVTDVMCICIFVVVCYQCVYFCTNEVLC